MASVIMYGTRRRRAATRAAEEAVQVGPRNTAFLSTLALARLRGGELEEALALMVRRGDGGLTPGEKATKAAILLALNREDDAAGQRRAEETYRQVGGQEDEGEAESTPGGMQSENGHRQLHQVIAGGDHQQVEQ